MRLLAMLPSAAHGLDGARPPEIAPEPGSCVQSAWGAFRTPTPESLVTVRDGVGVIDIDGPMFKTSWFGVGTRMYRDAVVAANRNDEIRTILLRIDSPGGETAGTHELARAVAESAKPVHAYIEDLGASAAYWVASQAKVVSTNEAGIVGSLGTYAVVWDMSALFAKEGIKVHVVSTGPSKGAGVPGTEIDKEYLDDLQQLVNGVDRLFRSDVAKGRRLSVSSVEKIWTGKVWASGEAKSLGLVDHVETFDAAFERVAGSARLLARRARSAS